MKIIAINRPAGQPIKSVHDIELYPDSAPLPGNRPVYLPELSTGFAAVVAPAFRICRLGKEIAPKFAGRYYDAVSAVARVYPLNSPVMPGIARPDAVKAFDASLITGPWSEFTPGQSLRVMTSTGIDVTLDPEAVDIDGLVAAVSAMMTLKTGDVIMPCYIPQVIDLEVGTKFTADVNDSQNPLIVKIK